MRYQRNRRRPAPSSQAGRGSTPASPTGFAAVGPNYVGPLQLVNRQMVDGDSSSAIIAFTALQAANLDPSNFFTLGGSGFQAATAASISSSGILTISPASAPAPGEVIFYNGADATLQAVMGTKVQPFASTST